MSFAKLAFPRKARLLFVLAVLAGATAACQAPMNSDLPKGAAGYEAIAVDPAQTEITDYLLVPNDEIAVRVYGEPELTNESVIIDAAGKINLALIGDVAAEGKSAGQLATEIEQAYAAQYVRDPRVSVQLKRGHAATIAVEGEVEIPGVFPYEPGQTLLTALALARSPNDAASLSNTIIFRRVGDQKLAGRFDTLAIRAGRMPDPELMPGDIIVVGYSSSRGALLDFIRTIPVIGYFRPLP